MSEEYQSVLSYVYVSELKGSNKWEMMLLCLLFCLSVWVLSTCLYLYYYFSRC